MITMFQKTADRFKNAPLSQKILYILLPSIFLLAFFALTGFLLIVRTTNDALYQTSASLTAYSSREISDHFKSASTMSDFIMSDQSIQKALSDTKDAGNGETPVDAYADIHSSLDTYYQRYRGNYIDTIQIITGNFTVSSYGGSHIMPADMVDELTEKAQEEKGGITWITDYRDTYGIFLVRTIRRIEYLRLDEIGVLIINIDLDEMMKDISSSNKASQSVSYLLRNDSQTLYAPDGLDDLDDSVFRSFPVSSYDICSVKGERYFVVPGQISSTDWDYYCLTSYEDMYNNLRYSQSLFIFMLLVVLLLCIVLTRRLIKPVMVDFSTLMTKIKSFGSKEFKVADVPYSYKDRKDEIGLLHQQFDSMTTEIRSLIRENYEAKLEAKDSQLKALEMQINPHFLYNTLQSINWRAKMLGDDTTSRMTESLGKLLRITLSSRNQDSSLGQELELVQHYMAIQEIRYDGSLFFRINVPDRLKTVYLPKFILQPLVENAIHYTVESDSDSSYIEITAHVTEYWVEIMISNTNSSFEDGLLDKLLSGEITPHGFGIGILNVYRRLNLTFGQRFRLSFYNENGFAVARISVPNSTKEEQS